MKISLLTQSINDYQHAVNQLQQLNKPAPHAEQIRNITMAYQSKPSMMNDGKDWARMVLQQPSKHHEMAVKWAKEVLKDDKQ